MRESRVGERLGDLVAAVDRPSMAQRAWRDAHRSRRRRVVGGAVAGVLLVGVGAAVVDGGFVPRLLSPGTDAPGAVQDGSSGVSPPAPLPPAPGEPFVQEGPEPAGVADLPQLPTRLDALSRLPSSAEALSANPVSRIVAAVQQVNGSVLVLGEDGAWREVDRGFGGPPGGDGNPAWSLASTSISPDARKLVLTRDGGLVLIDATTGQHRLLSVPATFGRIDGLIWLPDGERVAVSGDRGAGVLSMVDGSYSSTEDRVWELAVSHPGDPVVHLAASELVVEQAGATVRREYGTGRRVVLDDWYGAGWVNGTLVASTGFLGDGDQATSVIDVANARVTHLLGFATGAPPSARSNGCCATLGWLDEQTVLLRDGGQVLAWRFTSSVVYRVARLPETSAQGTASGHDTAIALAQP